MSKITKGYKGEEVNPNTWTDPELLIKETSSYSVAEYARLRGEYVTRYDAFKSAFGLRVEDTPEGFAAVCAAMDLFEDTPFFKDPALRTAAHEMKMAQWKYEHERDERFHGIRSLAQRSKEVSSDRAPVIVNIQ